MTDLSDEILSAYLDGRLSGSERAAVEQALATSPGSVARLDAMRATDTLLRSAHPLDVTRLDDPIARRVRSAKLNSPRRLGAPALTALAAGLAGIILGQFLPSQAPRTHSESFAATGGLERALDSLPSGGTRDGVEVVLSFKTADATPCRQFSIASTDRNGEGVACRQASGWVVTAWVQSAPAQDGAYHTAGADGVIDTVVDHIDASGALSASDEQSLIQRHWRRD